MMYQGNGHRLITAGLCVVAACQICASGPAWATDPGLGWGGAVSAPNGFTTLSDSINNHYIDGLAAVTIDGGGTTLLPGATVNAIGVRNQISVVGDDNIVEAIQDGENSGDVTSNVHLNE